MFLTLISIFLVLIQIIKTNGIPLATEDLSQYFPRIVGGEEATKGAAPHMAALVVSQHIKMLVCGASIVSRRHLLTAAHCVDVFVISGELLQSYHAIVGTNDWFHKGTDVRISKFYMHPQYDPQAIKHDVAVLLLEKSLTLGDKVGVITLNFMWIGGEEQAIVTGWGRLQTSGIIPFKLQKLSVNTLSPKQCAKDLLESPVWGNSPPKLQADVEICTFHSSERGLCHGDSGSALVLENMQVGVASWGYPCARGLPDVFARVSGAAEFLHDVL